MGLDTARIQKIYVNPHNHLVWVFTIEEYYVSSDRGLTFQVPDRPVRIPKNLVDDMDIQTMTFFGDTSIINFDFSGNPGLVFYIGDSMVVNENEDPKDYPYYFSNRLSEVLPTNIQLGGIAVTVQGNEAYIVAGTKSQGLFYTDLYDMEWKNLNRQTRVEKGLKEIITFPTVFDGSSDVGIGYQIAEDGDVTIKVFNYGMEEVRTIVREAPRPGGSARSENPQKDRWNGKDDHGNYVSTGMYYVLVKSSNGERGFGKVMVVYGRE